YKYPQAAYPYDDLLAVNRSRSRSDPEYELIDTGVFDADRYFDVVVEFAKENAEEFAIRVTLHNRGDRKARLHVLPSLWFRNTWSGANAPGKPQIRRLERGVVRAAHESLGEMYLACDQDVPLLFTENETNAERIFQQTNAGKYVKDGINDFVVSGAPTVNPQETGTKMAAHFTLEVAPSGSEVVRVCLGRKRRTIVAAEIDRLVDNRRADADEFYADVTCGLDEDRVRVVRQALAGMLWSKQFYSFDLDAWLDEHGTHALRGQQDGAGAPRNREWYHMVNDDVISMPDKWEYPWYAAWDLAFHTIPLAMVDFDFAKAQLDLMLRERYMHPNGQLPAYEWNFGDVNPPVHAFAVKWVYDLEKTRTGSGDVDFLTRAFNKLLLNFTWWVNRKDRFGKNVFEGGFLGLDNIGIFDRSAALPTGGSLEQADGTAWMALFSLNMLGISIELASLDPLYEEMAVKFAEHYLWIALAVLRVGAGSMWDEDDGFFYDVLRLPDGSAQRLKVRSLVGLLPLCAVATVDRDVIDRVPSAAHRVNDRMGRHPEIISTLSFLRNAGVNDSRIFAMLDEGKLRRVLARLLDEDEFWGPYGVRSISRYHLDHPYVLNVDGNEYKVQYLPGESDTGMFGGNSNWRGPVWMPINAMIYRALMQYHRFYGNDFKVECPTGSGRMQTLFEVANELGRRLGAIFLRDERGRRPVFGTTEKFQTDAHWRDNVLFYEYFHGDSGAGLGASHQTGWTGLIALILQLGNVAEREWVERGRAAMSGAAAPAGTV
ncbi:MAG: glucosidase, partial [Candidatus Eremiobacteraeota bacterium]|nr:glucosidase [Candidatus Eremiobacteraeota bacterium]